METAYQSGEAETPVIVFNGRANAVAEGGALPAAAGERVRFLVANATRDHAASFHV